MTHRIPEQALIPLIWNDDEATWELDIPAMGSRPLKNADDAHHDGRGCDPHGDGHDAQVCDEIWGRALAADLPTAEDLTHMLGFAMVRATAPLSADVDWRPVSPSLVGMLKDAIPAIDLVMSDSQRDALIRRLLPLFSSVDENAHRRGMADQRAATVPADRGLDRGVVRALISNAYYDARNAGETMEQGADRAADAVMALLGVKD